VCAWMAPKDRCCPEEMPMCSRVLYVGEDGLVVTADPWTG